MKRVVSASTTAAKPMMKPTERSMPAGDDDEGLAKPEQQRRDREDCAMLLRLSGLSTNVAPKLALRPGFKE